MPLPRPPHRRGRARPSEPRIAHQLRAYLDEHLHSHARLPDAAEVLGRSVPHLVRTFSTAFGIAPHQYVVGRRAAAAHRLLLDGPPPAQVAAQVGSSDQSHLTRVVERHTSTTPVAFRRSRSAIGAPRPQPGRRSAIR